MASVTALGQAEEIVTRQNWGLKSSCSVVKGLSMVPPLYSHCILQEKTWTDRKAFKKKKAKVHGVRRVELHMLFFWLWAFHMQRCTNHDVFFSMPFSLFWVPQDSLARTFSEPAKAMWRPQTIRGLASGYSGVFSEVPWLSHEKVGWLVVEPLPKWMEFLGWKS